MGIPEDKKQRIVTVVRMLVYRGRESWIDKTLESSLTADGCPYLAPSGGSIRATTVYRGYESFDARKPDYPTNQPD